MHRPTTDPNHHQPTPRRRQPAGGLRVLDLARANATEIRHLLAERPRYGDLHNQIARASMAVVFNLAEGRGMRTDRAKRARWITALGENSELAEQAWMLLHDQPDHPLHDRIDHVGRMLTLLVRALE